LILILEFIVIGALSVTKVTLSNHQNIVQAEEGDLTVTIRREQIYYKNNTELTRGYIYWADLKGGTLILYGNTSSSEMFSYAFWDSVGNYSSDRLTFYPDRIEIQIRTTELYYEIYGAYHPDYFIDTNFIVIFDTFWAQFSYITPEGEERYAPVNYYNKQVLPEGAGLVSYAPTDGALIEKVGEETYAIVWEYKERMMDPFHEPFPYEITYTFDPIYLAFTEQMFQNQQERQKNENEKNLLDMLKTYFKLIAFLAVILSIVAAIFGYLRARHKFKSKLQEAINLPKRMLKDIEREVEPSKRVSSMFSAGFFLLLLLMPVVTSQLQDVQTTEPMLVNNNTQIGLAGLNSSLKQEDRDIQYTAIIDLGKTGISFETVIMELPYTVENFSIWVNTESVIEFNAYDSSGLPISYQEFSDHYLIRNVKGYIRYEIIKPYQYYNNSNILVYIDYFWLNFFDYEIGNYSRADIQYTLILPEDSILYSASPESILTLGKTPEGRRKVTFTDYNRQIDPYHDLFSCQVTYSFIDVLDAIENESARFEHFRVETKLTQEQINTLTKNIMFLAFIAIIAPILAFLLSYYIMRNRMMKKIKEEEQKHELLISVEELQIKALNESGKIDENKEPWKPMLGGYWELLAYLSRYTPINLLSLDDSMHEKILSKYIPKHLRQEIFELLSTGRAISSSIKKGETIYFTKSQARDYLEAIMKAIEKMEKERKG